MILYISVYAGMQTQWQGALVCISGSHAAQCAAVVISLTVGCVIVSNFKHFVPLVSTRIGSDVGDLETPRLPVVLCPHSTMVRHVGFPTGRTAAKHDACIKLLTESGFCAGFYCCALAWNYFRWMANACHECRDCSDNRCRKCCRHWPNNFIVHGFPS